MPTIKNPGLRTNDGPISYADVLAAVPKDESTGDLRPDITNAGAIRTIVGRGSLSTVQRHLDAIRAELVAAAAPQPAGAVPVAPAEAVAAIWTSAWTAAHADVIGRIDRVTVERDQARARVEVLTADRDAATTEADDQREHAAVAVTASEQSLATLAAREAQIAVREAELLAKVDVEIKAGTEVQAALVRERQQAQHAAALVTREREIERLALQGQIDRLQERVAEFRAMEIWSSGKASQTSNNEG